jgi:hypothetical protein
LVRPVVATSLALVKLLELLDSHQRKMG